MCHGRQRAVGCWEKNPTNPLPPPLAHLDSLGHSEHVEPSWNFVWNAVVSRDSGSHHQRDAALGKGWEWLGMYSALPKLFLNSSKISWIPGTFSVDLLDLCLCSVLETGNVPFVHQNP